MKDKKENTVVEKVRVLPNEQGGILNVLEEEGLSGVMAMEVQQKELKMSNKKLTTVTKTAQIKGYVDTMMLLNYEAGDVMHGKIVVKYSLVPPIGSDPEAFLFWEEGIVRRTKAGIPIYRYSFYTEDNSDHDELCPD